MHIQHELNRGTSTRARTRFRTQITVSASRPYNTLRDSIVWERLACIGQCRCQDRSKGRYKGLPHSSDTHTRRSEGWHSEPDRARVLWEDAGRRPAHVGWHAMDCCVRQIVWPVHSSERGGVWVRAGVCPRVGVCAVVRALSCTLYPSEPLREGGHERGVSEVLHRACERVRGTPCYPGTPLTPAWSEARRRCPASLQTPSSWEPTAANKKRPAR